MRKLAIVVLLTFMSSGCMGYGIRKEPTDAERQLNHQNIGAGEMIENEATSLAPAIADGDVEWIEESLSRIKQAGSDVQSNSKTLALSPVGVPEVPEQYTPETSADLRVDVEEEADLPWWSGWLTASAVATAGGIALRVGGRFFPSLLGPAGGALAAVVEGIEIAKEHAGTDKQVPLDKLLASLKQTQVRTGTRDTVTRVVRRVNGNRTPASTA